MNVQLLTGVRWYHLW